MRVNLLLLIALALPGWAVSAEPQAQATVGDLSRVQSDTILYEAKAKRAEAKGKMQEQLAKTGDEQLSTQSAASPSVIASDLPTVTGSSGISGRLFATFLYGDGTTVTSKSGEQIPGGFLVSEVGIDRVALTKGDRRFVLKFGVANQPISPLGGSLPISLPGSVLPPPKPVR